MPKKSNLARESKKRSSHKKDIQTRMHFNLSVASDGNLDSGSKKSYWTISKNSIFCLDIRLAIVTNPDKNGFFN